MPNPTPTLKGPGDTRIAIVIHSGAQRTQMERAMANRWRPGRQSADGTLTMVRPFCGAVDIAADGTIHA